MKRIIIGFVVLLVLNQCKKEKTLPIISNGPIDKRDLFVGTYKVISDTPNYYFTCSKFDTLNQTWVRLNNVCNLFNMEFNEYQNVGEINQLSGLPAYFPIRDKYNKRWSFGVYSNDSVRNVNRIVNDTFRLYYRLQNTPWYGEDNTFYVDKMTLMVAVKEH